MTNCCKVPILANSLVGVLIRFRQEPVALVADIEGMFSQIRVDPKDWECLKVSLVGRCKPGSKSNSI